MIAKTMATSIRSVKMVPLGFIVSCLSLWLDARKGGLYNGVNFVDILPGSLSRGFGSHLGNRFQGITHRVVGS
jgi:hypothetical protein